MSVLSSIANKNAPNYLTLGLILQSKSGERSKIPSPTVLFLRLMWKKPVASQGI